MGCICCDLNLQLKDNDFELESNSQKKKKLVNGELTSFVATEWIKVTEPHEVIRGAHWGYNEIRFVPIKKISEKHGVIGQMIERRILTHRLEKKFNYGEDGYGHMEKYEWSEWVPYAKPETSPAGFMGLVYSDTKYPVGSKKEIPKNDIEVYFDGKPYGCTSFFTLSQTELKCIVCRWRRYNLCSLNCNRRCTEECRTKTWTQNNAELKLVFDAINSSSAEITEKSELTLDDIGKK